MIGSIVAEEELLADDELVMHIRSGDSILEVMDWITEQKMQPLTTTARMIS